MARGEVDHEAERLREADEVAETVHKPTGITLDFIARAVVPKTVPKKKQLKTGITSVLEDVELEAERQGGSKSAAELLEAEIAKQKEQRVIRGDGAKELKELDAALVDKMQRDGFAYDPKTGKVQKIQKTLSLAVGLQKK